MKIDNKITSQRLKIVFMYNVWLYILMAGVLITIFSTVEFYVNKPTDDEILSVWVDSSYGLDKSVEDKIIALGKEHNILENYWYNYSTKDPSYPTNFATIGIYNTDIFILSNEKKEDNSQNTIESFKDTGMFMDLGNLNLELENAKYYTHDGKNIGVEYGKYYIFVRNNGSITNELAKALIEMLVK